LANLTRPRNAKKRDPERESMFRKRRELELKARFHQGIPEGFYFC